MKRLITLLLFAMITAAFGIHARNVVVTSVSEIQNAITAAQTGDTILVASGVYNLGNKTNIPPSRVVIKSQSDNLEERATLQMQLNAPTINPEDESPLGSRPSLIFENIHLQSNNPTYTAGSYLLSFNGVYCSMDTLAFRNCEISMVGRSLIRGAQPADKPNSGEMEWLELSNCILHHMNGPGHEWPMFYVSHVPMYVNIRNNTFRDMPNTKSILQLNKQEKETGRNAEINFENNTVVITYGRADGVLALSNYLGEEAQIRINNNLFALPNWVNDTNQDPEASSYVKPSILKCKGGIVEVKNNIVEGYPNWESGQIFDEDGEGGFLVLDEANTYTMSDLGLEWTTFADPVNGDYTYLATERIATAGTDGGPIGDPRWAKTLNNPRTLKVTANIEDAVVTPAAGIYEDGEEVTITASKVDGYIFDSWKVLPANTTLSTDNPYTFNITADMEIQAVYNQLQARKIEITINGSRTATYAITPEKEEYFDGDEITITLNTHFINEFKGWSDGNTNLSRTETVSGNDIVLGANFEQFKYVLSWDLCQLTGNNQTFRDLPANHFSNEENQGLMNYIVQDTIASLSTRNNKFIGDGKELSYCVARRTAAENFSNPDYILIQFSTIGLQGVTVKSALSSDNSIFPTQKLQYSLDGATYNDFAVHQIDGEWNAVWRDFEGRLPSEAEGKDMIHVRWIADTTTPRLFAPGSEASETEFFYLTKIVVLADIGSSIGNVNADNQNRIFAVGDKLFIEASADAVADIYTIMGIKVNRVAVSAGSNEVSGLASGIYVVRVGSEVQKVIIK